MRSLDFFPFSEFKNRTERPERSDAFANRKQNSTSADYTHDGNLDWK